MYTLEDAVYIGIKNDISFLVGEMLNLYEHQSSRNPNMPMRGFLYLARNFESYIEQNSLNLYSSMLQKFPLPQYYIFYNGTEEEPDRKDMKLSDAKDYSTFIHYIRRNMENGLSLQQAMDTAIDDCIKKNILKELLVKCRGEVRNMVLSSFNQEVYERDLKAEARAEGRTEGLIEGETRKLIQLICKKLKKNKSPETIAEELEEELPIIRQICLVVEQCTDTYDTDTILEKLKEYN